MHNFLKRELLKQMEEDLLTLEPLLKQNPAAVNQPLLCALQALKEIFAQLEPIEKTVEIVQGAAPGSWPEDKRRQQAKAALTCLCFSQLIATCLNCTDENMLDNTLRRLNY